MKYIAEWSPDAQEMLLKKHLNIRKPCLLNLRIMTIFIQKAVLSGLNLYHIATIICRLELEEPSILETLYSKALITQNKTKTPPMDIVPGRGLYIDVNATSTPSSSPPSPVGFWASKPPNSWSDPVQMSPILTPKKGWQKIESLEDISMNMEENVQNEKEFLITLQGYFDECIQLMKAREVEGRTRVFC